MTERAPPPRNGPYFGIIPHWLARLELSGREFRVLTVIASRCGKPSSEPSPDGVETRIARIGTHRIADETNIARRHVQAIIRRLMARGILDLLRGGGRGHVTEYRVIFKRGADAINCAENGALSEAESSTESGPENAPSTGLNCTEYGVPTESVQKERTPPSGESRAREGEDFSIDRVDEKQGVLLLPINGGGQRMAPLRRYNPPEALVDMAAQLGINARADSVLGEFIDYYLERGVLPEDIDAAFRRWVRRQARFAERDAAQSQSKSPERRSTLEDALNALSREHANG
jgi:hypothetical protein